METLTSFLFFDETGLIEQAELVELVEAFSSFLS